MRVDIVIKLFVLVFITNTLNSHFSNRTYVSYRGDYFQGDGCSHHGGLQNVSHLSAAIDNFKRTASDLEARKNEHQDTDSEALTLIKSHFWGLEHGIVMELGALDGVLMSQSKHLLNLKWHRILIEGSPMFADRLMKRSRDAISFNVAVCDNEKEVHFAHARGIGGIVEYMSTDFVKKFHSGFLSTPKEKWLETYPNVRKISCAPMHILISETGCKVIDVFILDVEGVIDTYVITFIFTFIIQ